MSIFHELRYDNEFLVQERLNRIWIRDFNRGSLQSVLSNPKLNLMTITLMEFVFKTQEDLLRITLLFQQRTHQDCYKTLVKFHFNQMMIR